LSLKEKSSKLFASVLLLVFSVLLVVPYYYQVRFYLADAAYKNSVIKQRSLDQKISGLEKAVELNPYRGEYKTYLSNVYLNRAKSFSNKAKDKKLENRENVQKIVSDVKSAIDYAKEAVSLSANNVIFLQNLGSVYAFFAKDLSVGGADVWSIKNYKTAIELEPTNPALHNELGKVYAFRYSRSKSEDDIKQAINEFKKALGLKSDYLNAGLQLGLAYEAEGDNSKAIEQLSSFGSVERMESAISNPSQAYFIDNGNKENHIEIAFQLGRIYYNSGQTDKAKDIFLKILKISPTNSNARYSLALIFKKEGNFQEALKEFELVLVANPGNADVTEKISEVKKIIETENRNKVTEAETDKNDTEE